MIIAGNYRVVKKDTELKAFRKGIEIPRDISKDGLVFALYNEIKRLHAEKVFEADRITYK